MKKYSIQLILLLSLFLLPIYFSYGQFSKEHTSKFGKVSLEEVQMKKYDSFPEADAIILFETCKSTTTFDKIVIRNRVYYNFVTYKEIHKRIKILKKTGLDNGNINLNYVEERHLFHSKIGDNITDIKATTYIEENGKDEQTKFLYKSIPLNNKDYHGYLQVW